MKTEANVLALDAFFRQVIHGDFMADTSVDWHEIADADFDDFFIKHASTLATKHPVKIVRQLAARLVLSGKAQPVPPAATYQVTDKDVNQIYIDAAPIICSVPAMRRALETFAAHLSAPDAQPVPPAETTRLISEIRGAAEVVLVNARLDNLPDLYKKSIARIVLAADALEKLAQPAALPVPAYDVGAAMERINIRASAPLYGEAAEAIRIELLAAAGSKAP